MAILTNVALLKMRRTKIVATLGPASDTTEKIERLVAAGVDMFRLNMSHGSHEQHAANLARVRQAANDAKRPIAVLADLCGPKIRVGKFHDGGIDLVPGAEVVITARRVAGEPGLIHPNARRSPGRSSWCARSSRGRCHGAES